MSRGHPTARRGDGRVRVLFRIDDLGRGRHCRQTRNRAGGKESRDLRIHHRLATRQDSGSRGPFSVHTTTQVRTAALGYNRARRPSR